VVKPDGHHWGRCCGSVLAIEEKRKQEEIKILIAEDELIVAEDLAMTFQDLGYQVAGMAAT
jgi:hypothetical protein